MSEAKARAAGYQCPVRGCVSKNSKRFSSLKGVLMHIESIHGYAEAAKRLRVGNAYVKRKITPVAAPGS